MIFFVSSSSISDSFINNESFKFLMTSKPPPCLQRSEWLKVRALSALTIKNSEEPFADYSFGGMRIASTEGRSRRGKELLAGSFLPGF